MKLYAATKFDGTKKAMLNQLTGNLKQLYDPANAFDRLNQYPHAISNSTYAAAPSIASRVLTIPLHFWFCESVGSALPLIALQYSEVQIIVELKNIYQLFTIRDTVSTSPTYGNRIAPPASLSISTFLSPPTFPLQTPTNPNLTTWKTNPFIEANYIFVSDAELAHIATTDHSFLITQIDVKEAQGQYGPSSDLELGLRNLCTQVVWVGQRTDRYLLNDYDNYTNWENPYIPPISSNQPFPTPCYTSGFETQSGITTRDILLESNIVIDGKDRFGPKQSEFFSNIQNYRHHTGFSVVDIPGIYTYSFALEHNPLQPSGHINGSQFNKTILRNTYVQPPLASVLGVSSPSSTICVLKSTANNANPTQVNPNARDNNGNLLYSPDQVVILVQKTPATTLAYTYNVRAFIESYNFLRVIGGVANVVFSS
jgi:hypothetical protein